MDTAGSIVLLAEARRVAGCADDLAAMRAALADAARRLLCADQAAVHLLDADVRAPTGPPRAAVDEAFASGRPVVVALHKGSSLVVPLVDGVTRVGVLTAGWSSGPPPAGAAATAEALGGWASAALGTALRVRVERAGRARHDEACGRLRGIIRAAAAAQLAEDEDEVFEALGAAAREAGLNLHVTTLDATASALTVRHVTLVDADMGWLQRLLGRPPVGIRIPVDDVSPYRMAVREARPVFAEDPAEWVRASVPWLAEPALRTLLAGLNVGSAMAAPMMDGGRVLGVLSVWGSALGALELPTIEILGRVAGASVQGLRLRQREREERAQAELARSELEAILDASEDPVLLFAADGRLLRANRSGTRAVEWLGLTMPTLAQMIRVARARGFDIDEPGSAATRVQRGERVDQVCCWHQTDGTAQWLHVRGEPVTGEDGSVAAAVVSVRDVTHFHSSATERALLHGAVATARRVAHELNDQLQLLISYSELLPTMGREEARETASRIADAALAAGQVVHRLQRIVRFRETDLSVGLPALDLEAATAPDH